MPDVFGPLSESDVLGISTALGITRKQGEMVALLLTRPVLTLELVETKLKLKSDFKVLMCRLNKRLNELHGVATQTHYGVGYSLLPVQREALSAIILERSGGALDLPNKLSKAA
jgi:hypothetical protein